MPMNDILTPLRDALVAWTVRAAADGWLPQESVSVFDDATVATPAELFGGDDRPLVAALFGGTGVGKSSVMNRLAGEAVARTGVERPTSREVTLYAHRSVAMQRLPETLPLDRVRTILHGNDTWRDVLWLDMPDVDSVELANRDLVEAWLPHVDALLYVVSPERYRDDEGWRLLLEHASEHAWLFVFNQWDRGDARQLDDFLSLLSEAGLDDPLIFRTDCSGPAEGGGRDAQRSPQPDDDFGALESTLLALSERQLVAQLDARGVVQRARSLRQRSDTLTQRLGDATRLVELPALWQTAWSGDRRALTDAGRWRIETLAGANNETQPTRDLPGALLDESLRERIDRSVEHFLLSTADEGAAPAAASRRLITPALEALHANLPTLIDAALQQSLARPGGRWQRAAWKTAGILTTVLPVAAMLWIGWRVLDAFRDGAINPAAYLGSNFAVNSALLLALAWGLPLFVRRKLAPSRDQAIARGLQRGLERALDETGSATADALQTLAERRAELDTALKEIWKGMPTRTEVRGDLPAVSTDALPALLRRMVVG